MRRLRWTTRRYVAACIYLRGSKKRAKKSLADMRVFFKDATTTLTPSTTSIIRVAILSCEGKQNSSPYPNAWDENIRRTVSDSQSIRSRAMMSRRGSSEPLRPRTGDFLSWAVENGTVDRNENRSNKTELETTEGIRGSFRFRSKANGPSFFSHDRDEHRKSNSW